jgi:tight adherence protein C
MSIYILLVIVFFTVFLFSLAILLLVRRAGDPTIRRIREIEKSSTFGAKVSSEEEPEEEKESFNEKFERLLSSFSRLTKQDEEKISRVREHLMQAGYFKEESAKIFMGLKIVSAVVFFILFLYLGLLGDRSFSVVILLSLLIAAVGYRLPDIILNFKIRKRQGQIAKSLPDALDLLVISVEAGLGLNAALLRVGDDLALRCPPMSQEFIRVNQDLRTGMSREQALRNLADRNKVEDLRIFIGALTLSDRLGTSIGDTLRAQADSLRTRIRQKAEEQAAKASIKMLLPLVAFILPALIIILMGPGLISVYRTFNP